MSKKYENAQTKKKDINNIDYEIISNNLSELKNIIIGNRPIINKSSNFLENIILPEFLSFNQLKEKITKLFSKNNINDIYPYLLEEINNLYNKEKSKEAYELKQKIKANFFKILDNLNFFISYSILYISDSETINKSFDYFVEYIITDKEISKKNLSNYINIFNLKDKLFEYYAKERIKLTSITNCAKILNIISILKMQNIYTFKFIITEKNINLTNNNSIIYELYTTYNSSLKELKDLTNYFITIKENFVEPSIIKNILEDEDINNKIDNNIRVLLIEKIMKIYSFNVEELKGKYEKEIIYYYAIIFNNANIIFDNTKKNFQDIKKLFEYFNDNKQNEKNEKFFYLLNNIKNFDIINTYIHEKIFKSFLESIPIDKIIKIKELIINNKALINNILNNLKDKKDGIKLIKAFNLQKGEYSPIYDDFAINNYLNYKIAKTYENNFDILLSFALIDETIYNRLMFKLMKRIPKKFYESEEDNILGLKEEEEELNKSVKKNKKMNKNLKKLKNVIDNNVFIEKQKIQYAFLNADKKGYKLNNDNQILFNKIFSDKDITHLNFNINLLNIEEEDKCEPYDDSCMRIDLKKTKIFFVDNNNALKKYYDKYFKKYIFCGVDSEWREPIYPNELSRPSILQICNYNENCVLLIDLMKTENDKLFMEEFSKYFKNKKFIGYDFNRSDVNRFNKDIQNIFNNNNIIDIIQIYQLKYLKKCESLSKLAYEFFSTNLCKISQCSNWDIRPLSERQIHYASLDALICVKLYKKLLS